MTAALDLLLVALVLAALWTVQSHIVRAAIGLAVVSVVLTALMFQMGAPLAAVFELSVCAGLITAIFVSTISLTRRLTPEQAARCRARRSKAFHPAIVVAGCLGALLWIGSYVLDVAPAAEEAAADTVREVLWGARRLDLVGQIVVLFVGVYGVVILFKDPPPAEEAGR